MYDAGLFDPLDDDDQVCTVPTISAVSLLLTTVARIKSINVLLFFSPLYLFNCY
jgi:hypothetical protein